jgi:hypothetical protein
MRVDPKLAGLKARFFKAGDHRHGTKLKREFLSLRIPEPERQLLPLLVHPLSNETLWFFPLNHTAIHLETLTFPFSFLD